MLGATKDANGNIAAVYNIYGYPFGNQLRLRTPRLTESAQITGYNPDL